ncbi:MAG: hypothetical protein RL419_1257 [Actinomycetota bacterium]
MGVRPMPFTSGFENTAHFVYELGNVQHSLPNWRLMSSAYPRRISGSASDRALASRSLMTGSFKRPKLSASCPGGLAPLPFHQKFCWSTKIPA